MIVRAKARQDRRYNLWSRKLNPSSPFSLVCEDIPSVTQTRWHILPRTTPPAAQKKGDIEIHPLSLSRNTPFVWAVPSFLGRSLHMAGLFVPKLWETWGEACYWHNSDGLVAKKMQWNLYMLILMCLKQCQIQSSSNLAVNYVAYSYYPIESIKKI